MKHSQGRVAARNKTGWSPASSNVTQAAVHKGEMERTNNTKKHKKTLNFVRGEGQV